MENRVKIEILGSLYTVFTPESEEYTKSLAREIHEQAGLARLGITRADHLGALLENALDDRRRLGSRFIEHIPRGMDLRQVVLNTLDVILPFKPGRAA